MEIVVVTTVIIAVLANESKRETIINETRGMDLIAPPSVHWEIGNAFSAMLKRKRITLHQALESIEAYNKIPLHFSDVELSDSLKLEE